jgi:hypothetical protein
MSSSAVSPSTPIRHPGPADHRIRGTQIARDGQGDFRAPAEGRIDPNSESLEQSGLASIADGVPGWIGSHGESQTDHRADGAKIIEPHLAQVSVLEAPDLAMVDSGRSPDCPQAESRSDPGPTLIASEGCHRIPRLAAASVCWALPGRHRA